MKQEKLLKYENAKLHKQFIFNLPVSHEICGRQCPGCYALKAQIRFPKTVLPYREARYIASQQSDFAQQIIVELTTTRRSARAVRIHGSGEFYSQAYIDKWQTIATALPNFTFYAYTKRIKQFNFVPLMTLPNVVIIDSLMHGGLNYDKKENLSKSIFTCPSTGCGTTCKYCQTKTAQKYGVQFVKH